MEQKLTQLWNKIKTSSEQRKIKLIDYFDTEYIANNMLS